MPKNISGKGKIIPIHRMQWDTDKTDETDCLYRNYLQYHQPPTYSKV